MGVGSKRGLSALAKGGLAASTAISGCATTPAIDTAAVAKGRTRAGEACFSTAGCVGGDLEGSRRGGLVSGGFGGRRSGGFGGRRSGGLGRDSTIAAAVTKSCLTAGTAVGSSATAPAVYAAAVAKGGARTGADRC